MGTFGTVWVVVMIIIIKLINMIVIVNQYDYYSQLYLKNKQFGIIPLT